MAEGDQTKHQTLSLLRNTPYSHVSINLLVADNFMYDLLY